jgi:hypothetical protein
LRGKRGRERVCACVSPTPTFSKWSYRFFILFQANVERLRHRHVKLAVFQKLILSQLVEKFCCIFWNLMMLLFYSILLK